MDIASIALAAMQSKAAATKSSMVAGFMKHQHAATAQMVEMVAENAKQAQALAPPGQPGSLVSILA